MSWLKLALGLVSIVQWITREMHDSKQFSAGETKAVADALRRASDEIAKATAAGVAAKDRHAKDKTDGAFDNDFQRKD